MLKSRKSIRIIFIVLFSLMIMPMLLVGTKYSTLNVMGNNISNLSNEEKIELLKLEEYKKLGITTIEEFNSFWKNKIAKPSIPYWAILIPILLGIGCILFNKIAYWGLFAYSLYRMPMAIYNLFSKDSSFYSHIGSMFAIILFALCLILLFIPNVKNQFNIKSKQLLTSR